MAVSGVKPEMSYIKIIITLALPVYISGSRSNGGTMVSANASRREDQRCCVLR